jgi:hypothetical protein
MIFSVHMDTIIGITHCVIFTDSIIFCGQENVKIAIKSKQVKNRSGRRMVGGENEKM